MDRLPPPRPRSNESQADGAVLEVTVQDGALHIRSMEAEAHLKDISRADRLSAPAAPRHQTSGFVINLVEG